jgi:hypothetical protein
MDRVHSWRLGGGESATPLPWVRLSLATFGTTLCQSRGRAVRTPLRSSSHILPQPWRHRPDTGAAVPTPPLHTAHTRPQRAHNAHSAPTNTHEHASHSGTYSAVRHTQDRTVISGNTAVPRSTRNCRASTSVYWSATSKKGWGDSRAQQGTAGDSRGQQGTAGHDGGGGSGGWTGAALNPGSFGKET